MNDLQSQVLKERIAELPNELQKFLASDELQRKIDLLAKKHSLTEDQQTAMENEIGIVLLVLDSTSNLAHNLSSSMNISPEAAGKLAEEISDYILKRVSKFLAHSDDDLTIQTEDKVVEKAENHPPKEQILEEIEKPFKTVITKYVIEYDHKPMSDSSHLLEDKVDEVPKLKEHWED